MKPMASRAFLNESQRLMPSVPSELEANQRISKEEPSSGQQDTITSAYSDSISHEIQKGRGPTQMTEFV